MLGLRFTVERQGGNHDVYEKKPFTNIEMHRRLISEDSPYSHYLSRTWDRASLKSGSQFIYELDLEDFYNIYLDPSHQALYQWWYGYPLFHGYLCIQRTPWQRYELELHPDGIGKNQALGI